MRRRENRAGSPNGGGNLVSSRDHTHNGCTETHTGDIVQDQVDTVFGIGDPTHKGYLTLRDFQNIFRACQIQFPLRSEERRRRTPNAMPDVVQVQGSLDRYGPRG
ncbi:hypothetical protein LSM04_005192 [Trypanosoma melophagium]|uniref:uncharacterized protein n=1 Tax=Trypanosoma melophagium TaxID=715481 RepID=UPI003519DACC|nr:hypothetical protein LSM04_005192 [Trypanosoma melophagium]